jgi:hypothetical protein
MSVLRLAETLGRPVLAGETKVGEVSGVLLDRRQARVIGLEVVGPDRERRFLPWVAAAFVDGTVQAPSVLHLVDEHESYERHGAVRLEPGSARDLSVSREGSVVVSAPARAGSYTR